MYRNFNTYVDYLFARICLPLDHAKRVKIKRQQQQHWNMYCRAFTFWPYIRVCMACGQINVLLKRDQHVSKNFFFLLGA